MAEMGGKDAILSIAKRTSIKASMAWSPPLSAIRARSAPRALERLSTQSIYDEFVEN